MSYKQIEFILFITVLGSFIGSFLHVLVVRMPVGQSIVFPSSRCDSCKSKIPLWNNIPIISSLMNRAKCRSCSTFYGWEPFFFEFLSAIWALICTLKMVSIESFALELLCGWGLLVALFIDLHHRIIPNSISMGGMVLGGIISLANSFFIHSNNLPTLKTSLPGFVFGFIFFWGFAVLFKKIRGIDGLGGGDIKLLGAVGVLFGINGLLTCIFMGSVLGILSLLPLMLSRKITGKFPLPFGPFLAIGSFIHIIWFGESSIANVLLF